MEVASAIEAIESVIVSGSDRGAEVLAESVRGDLQRAAESLAWTSNARVAIVTGFLVPTADGPTPETDGPVGAAVLAAALTSNGAEVSVVTDGPCADVVRAALQGFGGLDAVPVIVAQPSGGGEANEPSLSKVLGDVTDSITHVVFVERPGPSADGTYRSMNGDALEGVAPLEQLAQLEGAYVIAIGDGGNEVGMGKLPAGLVERSVRHGSEIASTTGCDALVVAAVSNWGAYGLAAALLALSSNDGPNQFQALDIEAHRSSLRATVAAGAVDGVSGEQADSVDGFGWDVYRQVLVAASTFAELAERAS